MASFHDSVSETEISWSKSDRDTHWLLQFSEVLVVIKTISWLRIVVYYDKFES